MNTLKVDFHNPQGAKLAARIELPANGKPHNFVLFAHCFTCNKNLTAVRNISRSLTLQGFGVMRFDFTGLGESEGDFADTNFSSNIEDLIVAAGFLEENYKAPALLIGHSLGGAAVVFAAAQLPSVKAVATIGAPSDPAHVQHLFKHGMDDIKADGAATLQIGGREFTIKKQFIEDIAEKNMHSTLEKLRKAILVLHSPQDTTVGIENAANIYAAARHPKSFVSLDGADHLLSSKKESMYAGETIACWVKKYIELPEEETLESDMQVVARLQGTGYTTEIQARQHGFVADEPRSFGGSDLGPSPYELVAAGLGACTAITLRMYAARKDWDLQEVLVHIDHDKKHTDDCEHLDPHDSTLDHFDRVLELKGNLDAKQRERLLAIANKCPVHKMMHNQVVVHTKLQP